MKDREFEQEIEVHTEQMAVLGVLMAKERKRLGMNQHDLAVRVGLSRQALARIEKRPENASLGTITRIARVLGHSLRWMLKRASTQNVTRV